MDEWLVEQANQRGFFGAFGVAAPIDAPDPSVTLEAIVCGLLQPHGVADGRLFKLVVRILQSGQVDTRALSALARRERSDHVLAWLLDRVPEAERNGPLEAARAAIHPPRGHRAPRMVYDGQRLIRRPFRASEAPWTLRPGSS